MYVYTVAYINLYLYRGWQASHRKKIMKNAIYCHFINLRLISTSPTFKFQTFKLVY